MYAIRLGAVVTMVTVQRPQYNESLCKSNALPQSNFNAPVCLESYDETEQAGPVAAPLLTHREYRDL